MPAAPSARRRVELVVVPLVAAVCMAFIIGAIVLDRNAGTCPAATWNNQVALALDGDQGVVSDAAAITACTGPKCIPANPTFAKATTNKTGILSHQPDGTWVLNVGTQRPTLVTFRVFDVAGNLLGQQSNTLNWTRVGGTEQCGGPMSAIKVPVHLQDHADAPK